MARYVAPHPELLGDEREYSSAAAILADGRGLAFVDAGLWVRSPLYIVLLGGLFRLFGTGLAAIWVVQVALGLMSVALLYLLARLLDGRRATARLAALLGAAYLPFAAYAGLLLSETLFVWLLLLAFVGLAWHARRGGWGALVVAGAALGAACLTRGSALPFLAAVPVWAVALRGWRDGAWRGALPRAALVVGVALALIAPWTARNAVAYRALIPIETTGGYNFWLGAMGGRNAGQIEATFREIPNQGRRQAVAWARGRAIVRADPAAYAARAIGEAADLWRVNFGANERLLRGYGAGRVPPTWLALTFALDDLLYLAALPLAVVGWCAGGLRRGGRWLLGLWLGYTVATAAAFFAINRFRLPLMPVVLLLAARGAVALADWWRAGRSPRPTPRRWLAPAIVAALLLALVAPTIAPDQYLVGARRWGDAGRLAEGYALIRAGQAADALALFESLPPDFTPRPTALAAAYHALGRDDRALATLDDALDPLGAILVRGDIFRARGDTRAAFEEFNYREVRVANPTDDAWARLNPPPVARLDVGNGLDLGYVRGVHLDERDPDGTTYRWTTGAAEVRLAPPPGAGGLVLRLRLRGYRPAGPMPAVRVSVDGREVGTVAPGAAWGVAEFALPPLAGPTIVRLAMPTFVPGYADQRPLGAMLDWAEIAAVGR